VNGKTGTGYRRTWLERAAVALTLAALVLPLAAPAAAQGTREALERALEGISIDQRLDEQVPLDLRFTDSHGRAVRLGELLRGRPAILSLVYYECPMLCTMILNGLSRSLKPVRFSVGHDYDVIVVSINPRETPELADEKKRVYVKQYNREGAAEGFHFLTGEEDQIRQLAAAVGFRYTYDAETGLYNHASGIMVLTPEGRLSRYFYGIEFPARDLRLGLVEASERRIGSPVDAILLYCFHYDPTTGRYGLLIMNVMRLAAIATVLVLGGFIAISFRRDRRRKHESPGETAGKTDEGGAQV
jgi:protein SCO1